MRWLQRDPILLDGGDNFYEYVMGNPVRYVDPTGEAAAAVSVLDALAAAIVQAAGEVSAGAVAGAASAGTVIGVGAGAVAGGIGLACLLDLDGCQAAWEGFCDEQGIDPNLYVEDKAGSGAVDSPVDDLQSCINACSGDAFDRKVNLCLKLKRPQLRQNCLERAVRSMNECINFCHEIFGA